MIPAPIEFELKSAISCFGTDVMVHTSQRVRNLASIEFSSCCDEDSFTKTMFYTIILVFIDSPILVIAPRLNVIFFVCLVPGKYSLTKAMLSASLRTLWTFEPLIANQHIEDPAMLSTVLHAANAKCVLIC